MGWLQRLRSGRKAALEPDFSGQELAIGKALNIDVHSHIVPGVDDGSSTLEESLELIERLVGMAAIRVLCACVPLSAVCS